MREYNCIINARKEDLLMSRNDEEQKWFSLLFADVNTGVSLVAVMVIVTVIIIVTDNNNDNYNSNNW